MNIDMSEFARLPQNVRGMVLKAAAELLAEAAAKRDAETVQELTAFFGRLAGK